MTALTVLLQLPRSVLQGAPGDTLSWPRDSLAAVAGAVRDTLTPPPLPGGVAAVLRFLFQVPQWIQIGGAVLGAIVAAIVVVYFWRRRLTILNWIRSRSRQLQLALAGGVLAALAVASFAGVKSWDYMQHANAFCTGCHIMERPFQRFAVGAGRHENLKCHDCHQQSLFASARQLVLWVAERPQKIGVHAPVPNTRCEGCHQVPDGHEKYQEIFRLAGHKVHFESDSAPLKELTCVKCHGAEIHKFLPSARTCEQSGCHEKQAIRLSHMARLPEISCVSCHNFTAQLPALASRDSAVRTLVPSHTQCLGCHGMQGKPSGFDLAKDPHKGSCGTCHDVHTDLKPVDARKRCAECHASAVQNAFHTGANHRRVREQCLTCHQPHAASLDASDCVGCHTQVRRRGLFKPPLPFDTSAVLRHRVPVASAVPAPQDELHRGKGDALPDEELPRVRASPATRQTTLPTAAPADSFAHSRHSALPCLTCHIVNRPGAGLVFQAPRGCDLCHHQALIAGRVEQKDCTRCHAATALAQPLPMVVAIQVDARAPKPRTVGFRHERHQRIACSECHQPPQPSPPDSIRSCSACHAQHHTERRDCSQCHNLPETKPAHSRTSHTGCVACHTPVRIAELIPARSFCLTCHEPQRQHQPGKECSTCHFLESPAEFRHRLMERAP